MNRRVTDGVVETRVVVIDRAPPKRALSAWRGRTTKRAVDVDLWQQCMAPVRELVTDGWRKTRVTLDWGSREPMTPRERERAAREVTECWASCELIMTAGSPGRGTTTMELER